MTGYSFISQTMVLWDSSRCLQTKACRSSRFFDLKTPVPPCSNLAFAQRGNPSWRARKTTGYSFILPITVAWGSSRCPLETPYTLKT